MIPWLHLYHHYNVPFVVLREMSELWEMLINIQLLVLHISFHFITSLSYPIKSYTCICMYNLLLCIMWHHIILPFQSTALHPFAAQKCLRTHLYHIIHCIKTQHCIVYYPILCNLSYYMTTLNCILSYATFCHTVNCCSASIFSWSRSKIRVAGC